MSETIHIVVAMKPLDGNFAQNALEHEVAGLNIDASRIPTSDSLDAGGGVLFSHQRDGKQSPGEIGWRQSSLGRFPANVILEDSDEIDRLFPDAGSNWKRDYGKDDYKGRQYDGGCFGGGGFSGNSTYCDSGSAVRFFKRFGER